MNPHDLIMLSISFFDNLSYEDSLNMIRSYLFKKDRFYFQLYMFSLQYKAKIQNKLHIRLDFDMELVVIKKEDDRKKIYIIILEVKLLPSYD